MKIDKIACATALLFTSYASTSTYAGEVASGTYVTKSSFTKTFSTTSSFQSSYIIPAVLAITHQGSNTIGPRITGHIFKPAAVVSLGTSALLETVTTDGQTAVIQTNVPFTSTISPDITIIAVSTVTISSAVATTQIVTTTSLSAPIPTVLSDTLPSTISPTFSITSATSSAPLVLASSPTSTSSTPSIILTSILSSVTQPSTFIQSSTSTTFSNSVTITSSTSSSPQGSTSLEDSSLSTHVASSSPIPSLTPITISSSMSIEISQSSTRTSTTSALATSSNGFVASISSETQIVSSNFSLPSSTVTQTSTLLTTAILYSTTRTTTRTTSIEISRSNVSTTDTANTMPSSAVATSTSFITVIPVLSSAASSFPSSIPISTGLLPASLRTITATTYQLSTTTSTINLIPSGPATIQMSTTVESIGETFTSSPPDSTVTITKTQNVCGSGSTIQRAVRDTSSQIADSIIPPLYSTSTNIILNMTNAPTNPNSYQTPTCSSLPYATTGTSNVPVMPWMATQTTHAPSAVSSMNATSTQLPLAYTGAASHETDQARKFAFLIGFVALALLH